MRGMTKKLLNGSEEASGVKHRITVEVETKRHFLGIPYTATEKKHITVDGQTYRKMKKKNSRKPSDGERKLRPARPLSGKKN